VDYAHQHQVSVEGELGVLAGIENDVQAEASHYTKPEEVEQFIYETGVGQNPFPPVPRAAARIRLHTRIEDEPRRT